MKKIVIVLTGGTIAMRIDPNLNAAVPSLNAEELIGSVRFQNSEILLEERELFNVPSPHITPYHLLEIRKCVIEALEEEDTLGVIVTHGTDTLEETAYFLDITIDNDKPIVVTGAMRNASELGYDGGLNITSAIATILNKDSVTQGTLVVMNNEVHSAYHVVKTNTLSVDTFKSPEIGPLGIIDNDEVIYYRRERPVKKVTTDKLEEKIALVKCALGISGDVIEFYLDRGYKGLVIEALGRGNVPPKLMPAIKKALSMDVPVVMVSRCPTGRVLGSYGYEGGGKELLSLGVINGGFLPGHKVRIALMALVGANYELIKIDEFFKEQWM